MELLHIGKRVKFASYTIYSSWNEVLGTVSICSLRASVPYSIPIWSSHMCAKVTTSYNMATPNTLIAILLSHLHALYNIIILAFVIAISLFLGRRRRRRHYCSSTTAPTGGGQRCRKRWSQRGRWPRRRLYYYTKVGSRDRGLVAERSSLESLADVNHALCEAKYGASYGSSPNNRLNYRFKRATVVAATNYKTGDTKIRTDWTNMIGADLQPNVPLKISPT